MNKIDILETYYIIEMNTWWVSDPNDRPYQKNYSSRECCIDNYFLDSPVMHMFEGFYYFKSENKKYLNKMEVECSFLQKNEWKTWDAYIYPYTFILKEIDMPYINNFRKQNYLKIENILNKIITREVKMKKISQYV